LKKAFASYTKPQVHRMLMVSKSKTEEGKRYSGPNSRLRG
jgi:hypothetical protein